jgi:hypothetical protein
MVLDDLRALGEVRVENGNIIVDLYGFRDPPAGLADEARCHKSKILALLGHSMEAARADVERAEPEPELAGWPASRWQAFHADRAAGGRAYECCVIDLMNRMPPTSPPGRCAACGESFGALLPIGPEPHAWLHARCWSGWRASRRTDAIEQLKQVGISQCQA